MDLWYRKRGRVFEDIVENTNTVLRYADMDAEESNGDEQRFQVAKDCNEEELTRVNKLMYFF
jgi:hypothetical protein